MKPKQYWKKRATDIQETKEIIIQRSYPDIPIPLSKAEGHMQSPLANMIYESKGFSFSVYHHSLQLAASVKWVISV